MKFELRDELISNLEKLYQSHTDWCLEAGVSPHSDLNVYVNYLLFQKCEEENAFFIRRNELKILESLDKLPISGVQGTISFN